MPDAYEDVLQISFDAFSDTGDESDTEEEDADIQISEYRDDRFQVVEVEGEECLSGLFEYEVVFEEPTTFSGFADDTWAESGAAGWYTAADPLPIDKLIGTDVTLSFRRDDHIERHVNGIVAQLVHDHTSGPQASADRQRYRVTIRPELWLLTLTNDYRSFVGKTVPDIVATLLEEYQIPYDTDSLDNNLNDQYRKRRQCVQSGESTFRFIDDLLEEAGIFYFFRQDRNSHDIVFGDNEGVFSEDQPPVLRMGTTDQNDEKTLWRGALEENVVPDGHEIVDTHFEGASTVRQRESGEETIDRKGRPLDVVEYPGGADRVADEETTPRDHGEGILRRRLQQHRASQRVLRGRAPVRQVGAGQVFELQGHDHTGINGDEFVLRRLRVEASSSDGYEMEYEAFPRSTRYRGPRYSNLNEHSSTRERTRSTREGTPSTSSKQPGPESLGAAAAIGNEDLSLHLGEIVSSSNAQEKKRGKVKVRFDWAEGSGGENGAVTVWARLLHPSASPSDQSWGSQFVPREGTRVLVACEHDWREASGLEPIVLGSLYQGNDRIPYPNDGNTETHSAIRTRSDRGDDDAVHNELRFVDEKDEEELGTFAPHKRVEATGFEEDVQGKSLDVTVYELNPKEKPGNFVPEADKTLTEGGYNSLPSGEDEAKYWITSKARIMTNLPFGSYEDEISSEHYDNLPEKSTFYLKTSYEPKYFKDEGSVDESIEGIEKYEEIDRGEPKYTLKKKEEYKRLRKNGEMEASDAEDIGVIGIENYEELEDKTSFQEPEKDEDYDREDEDIEQTPEEALSKDEGKKGYEKMLKNAEKSPEMSSDDISEEEVVHDVILGKDAYEKPDPTQECYELRDSVGRDAYEGPSPHQGVYSSSTGDPFGTEDAGANRIEYTTGDPDEDGVLEACNGSYRIHAHGPKLEIYRTGADVNDSSTPSDFFDQEFGEDWSIDGPDELDSFEDDNPIVILNKNGAINIKSDNGINIESGGDINIQTSESINMRAGNNIEAYADDEFTQYGRDILIGKKRGIDDVSVDLTMRSTFQNIKAKISKIEADVVGIERKVSDDTETVSNDTEMVSNSQIYIGSTQRLIWNDQTLLANSDILLGASLVGISLGQKIVKLENDAIDIETDSLYTVSKLASIQTEIGLIKDDIAEISKGAAEMATKAFKKGK